LAFELKIADRHDKNPFVVFQHRRQRRPLRFGRFSESTGSSSRHHRTLRWGLITNETIVMIMV
jgi:hypothetical protein